MPCGTQIQCNFPCNREPPPCGHPKTNHSCHESEGCPPCPFLTSKVCACGKMTLPNARCSLPKVSCGTPCGKPLPCGFHTCRRMCHGDDCGVCESVCGKDRKLWYVVDVRSLLSTNLAFTVFRTTMGVPCHVMLHRPVRSMIRAKALRHCNVHVDGSSAK